MTSSTVPAEQWNEVWGGRHKGFAGQAELDGARIWVDTQQTVSGQVVFHPTSDGASGGTALFTTIHAVFIRMGATDALVQCGEPTISGDKKTITIDAIEVTDVLLGLLQLDSIVDGRNVSILVYGE